MPGVYLMSRKWSLTDRFTIADEAGVPQFEVQGGFGLTQRQSFRDTSGTEVAVISQRAFSSRYEIKVADSEDPVLMLAVVLVIETIKARRRAAAVSGGM